ncbi:MAG: FAD-dependent oxidoreductase [Rhodospirillaceae bacterium]|jgi:3-phenylpropionate/trans-cinnamate dioxygenase ferredoxin reductase component|nr:FAD-dependent oxidoreductase [Rhodospirillaceae bacterium]MBT5242257.1 FAD-dependent oxidoreductase [Rhodospirillaceae bacterium]MBT5565985.1 FAD-dependent oxidoreductase [Rhodospirillaceae bacterium]MBT6088595.1 FAD-dependent oxidoreductase [Rhodospirillaceae bacterium]MBT7449199.1 FAD-dependent oxidoreductase [Rhodospirillaceae bacterium]
MTNSVVIVGAGEAGGQTAISLRQGGYDGTITVIGDEPYIPYERPALSKQFLAGELDMERLYLRAEAFYDERDIALKLDGWVDAITPGQSVAMSDGEVEPAASIVLATGGRVRPLPVDGADLSGVHFLRTIDDVLAFRDRLKPNTKLAIVGGGYIGLEVAAVATKLGCAVTVLEMTNRVLNRVAAPVVSDFYTRVHREAGVDIRTDVTVSGFEGDTTVKQVVCTDGSRIDTDVVIIGIGIIPNVELAEAAGLAVENGITVDAMTRTSAETVYAVGDCTNHPNDLLGRRLRLESVQNALSQGKTAANAILGKAEPYAEIPWFWSDQYDIKLQMVGINDPDDQVIVRGDSNSRSFSVCYLRDGVLVAVNALNRPKDFIHAKKAIAAKVTPDSQRLADPEVPIKSL